MTLQDLLEIAIQHQLIKDTHVKPMQTAVRHYAAMLGVDPDACLPAVYDLTEHQLTALVHTHAPAHWTRRTRSTFANRLQGLLRLGREQGWLEARGSLSPVGATIAMAPRRAGSPATSYRRS